MKDLKIVFMGTPEFAATTLEKLVDADYNVVGVITAPDRPAGRGRKLQESAVKKYSESKGLKVLQPTNLKNEQFLEELKSLNANLQIVVAFRMLPKAVWAMPEYGTFNLHASLLPHYRGAAPIQRAIMNGERETGLTTFIIRKLVDTGSILMRVKVPINDSDTYGTLSEKMSKKGAYLLLETLNRLKDNSLSPQEQEHSIATSAPKIKEGDTRIDWAQPAEIIHNQIRGLAPIPGAFTYWKGMRFKILRSRINQSNEKKNPGSVAYCDKKQLIIQAGYGQIKLLTMQREGKKIMETPDFLNGVDVIIGDTFGD